MDQTAFMKLLLDNGANIDLCDAQGASPLMWAVDCGQTAAAQLLLERGADPSICDTHGDNPLIRACDDVFDKEEELLPLVETLLAKGTLNVYRF